MGRNNREWVHPLARASPDAADCTQGARQDGASLNLFRSCQQPVESILRLWIFSAGACHISFSQALCFSSFFLCLARCCWVGGGVAASTSLVPQINFACCAVAHVPARKPGFGRVELPQTPTATGTLLQHFLGDASVVDFRRCDDATDAHPLDDGFVEWMGVPPEPWVDVVDQLLVAVEE
jgi:hypothetical protein